MVFEGDSLKDYRIDVKNDKVVKIDLPNVEERKVGKWILPDKYYDKNIWRKCSVCNTHFEKYHKYVTFSGEVTYTEEIANYCKVCGAETRG